MEVAIPIAVLLVEAVARNLNNKIKMTTNTNLFPAIESTIDSFDLAGLAPERIKILQPLIDYIQDKTNKQQNIRLNLICTHNSRRSILAQVWTQAAATYYNIDKVYCYSGGTEATAVYPVIIETLEKSGFIIKIKDEGLNPVYAISYAENESALLGFSKTYDNHYNPGSEFVAIMTCSQADAGCPFIAGAEKRIPITYEDPKEFDHTAQQQEKYWERSQQIGTEMLYVFSQIKK